MAKLIAQDPAFAETAPVIAERTATVDGTPADVWAVILDYPRWSEWFPGVKTCVATSEPATGLGSTRTVTLPGGVAVQERFIIWDEPEAWGFTALTGPSMFKSLVERITIKPLGPRLTEVTYRMAFKPSPGFGLVVKLVRGRIEKNLGVAMRNLNAEVVAARPAPAEPIAIEADDPPHDHDHDHPHDH